MSAGPVAAGDERRALRLDGGERCRDVLGSVDAGRIALRADQDEVVVHDRKALHAETVGDEFLFLRLGVHEHDVGIAAPAGIERLAGALCDDLHIDPALCLEQRQDVTKQAGILGRRGGGDDDRLVLRQSWCSAGEKSNQPDECVHQSHGFSLHGQISNSPAVNIAASAVCGEEKN
jgi:hypothetical protein